MALALAMFGSVWTALALVWPRDLRLASCVMMVAGPLLVGLWPGDVTKPDVAAAGVASAGGLLVGTLRARDWEATCARLGRHPLAPFVFLYAACGLYGLMWGIWRGNEVALMLGQTWTAALFVIGFVVAGPVVARHADVKRWSTALLVVAVACLPAFVPLLTWAQDGDEAQFARFLAPTAFYAPIGALIALAVVAPSHRRLGCSVAGMLAVATLLTFTRSYWLGLLVGGLLLLGLALLARRRDGRSLRTLTAGRVAGAAVAVVVLALGAALTPVGRFVVERGAQTRAGSGDLSVEVRSLELRGAVRQVAAAPVAGVGSGGSFVALRQLGDEQVFYGPTNFVHNAYLYFPLKFGALGFAALIALIGGALATLGQAARRARREGLASVPFAPAAVAVLALSITAPNLIDPRYSLFAGSLMYLAGARSPVARPA